MDQAQLNWITNFIWGFSGATVRSISMVVPPYAEQEKVIEKIEAENATFNTAIARTEREIALMQEYRTRLAADLVMGKLDAREAAAKLPAQPTDKAIETVADEPLEELEIEEVEP